MSRGTTPTSSKRISRSCLVATTLRCKRRFLCGGEVDLAVTSVGHAPSMTSHLPPTMDAASGWYEERDVSATSPDARFPAPPICSMTLVSGLPVPDPALVRVTVGDAASAPAPATSTPDPDAAQVTPFARPLLVRSRLCGMR